MVSVTLYELILLVCIAGIGRALLKEFENPSPAAPDSLVLIRVLSNQEPSLP